MQGNIEGIFIYVSTAWRMRLCLWRICLWRMQNQRESVAVATRKVVWSWAITKVHNDNCGSRTSTQSSVCCKISSRNKFKAFAFSELKKRKEKFSREVLVQSGRASAKELAKHTQKEESVLLNIMYVEREVDFYWKVCQKR